MTQIEKLIGHLLQEKIGCRASGQGRTANPLSAGFREAECDDYPIFPAQGAERRNQQRNRFGLKATKRKKEDLEQNQTSETQT
jgi:hypothetical protein